MPVPKRKTSKARRDKRASNNSKLTFSSSVASCQTCQSPIVPHAVCSDCGYYKGIKVMTTKTDRMHKRGEVMKTRQKETATAPEIKEAEVKEAK